MTRLDKLLPSSQSKKTIHEGGYNPSSLGVPAEGEVAEKVSVAKFSKSADIPEIEESASAEERLTAAIKSDPTNIEPYLQLADLCTHETRYSDAEFVLTRASEAIGSGDLRIVERLEDLLLKRAARQLAIADQQAQQDPTEENQELAVRVRNQANQAELEIYATRSAREPGNAHLKYELGIRFKRVGKYKDAISALQSARSEKRRLGQVLLELGECFQRIEQYKLALSNYEEAIEACQDADSETRRLALYRAGVLSSGMKEFDRAEKHLTDLAGLDFSYRDVAERLDKLSRLRDSG